MSQGGNEKMLTTPLATAETKRATSDAASIEKALDAEAGKGGEDDDYIVGSSFGAMHKDLRAEGRQRTFYERFFFMHYNATFGKNLELAFRGAVVVSVLGFFLQIQGFWPAGGPDKAPPILQFFLSTKLFSASVCLMFVYSLGKNMGDVIASARAGLTGTLYFSIATWVMFGLWPEGGSGKTYTMDATTGTWAAAVDPDLLAQSGTDFTMGLCYGMCLTLFTLMLNFDNGVKIFCVSNFVFPWMDFLSVPGNQGACPSAALCPNLQASHWTSFKSPLNVDAFDCAEWLGLWQAFGAVMFAILTTVVPYRLSALKKAQRTSVEVAIMCGKNWAGVLSSYCGGSLDKYKRDRMIHDMGLLKASMSGLEGNIKSSWWECLGKGKAGHSRHMMTSLEDALDHNYQRLLVVVACLGKTGYGQMHNDIMRATEVQIKEIVLSSSSLMVCVAKAAADGDVDDTERADMVAKITDVKAKMQNLTRVFRAATRQFKLEENREKMLDELALTYQLCCYARLTYKYGESVLQYCDEVKAKESGQDVTTSMQAAEIGGIGDIFLVSAIKANMITAFKNSGLIFFGMALGYHGVNPTGTTFIIANGNAAIACTVCVLMGGGTIGSAIVNNMNRLQGTVLGTVVGLLMYGFMGQCEPLHVGILTFVLFFYEFLTLFIYFHSSTSAYLILGMMLAAMAPGKVLVGCKSEPAPDASWDPVSLTFGAIVNFLVASTLLTLVDLVVDRERAADKAFSSLTDGWEKIKDSLDGWISPINPDINFRKSGVKEALATAATMGTEAEGEPRYWRTPFKNSLFRSCIRTSNTVQGILVAMQHACTVIEDTKTKNALFKKAIESKNLQNLFSILRQKANEVELAVQVLRHETDSRSYKIEEDMKKKLQSALALDYSKDLTAFCNENQVFVTQNTELETLESSANSSMGFVLTCLRGAIMEIDSLTDEVLRW